MLVLVLILEIADRFDFVELSPKRVQAFPLEDGKKLPRNRLLVGKYDV